MVPMRLFRSRAFSSGIAASFLFYAAMYGVLFLLPQFLQTALGYGPFGAGLRLLPWTATLFVTAPIAGALVNKVGERPLVVIGLLMQAIGLGWIAMIAAPGVAYSSLVAPLVLAGVGVSMAMPAAQNAILGSVAVAEMGKASGVFNMGALSRRHVRHRRFGRGIFRQRRGRFAGELSAPVLRLRCACGRAFTAGSRCGVVVAGAPPRRRLAQMPRNASTDDRFSLSINQKIGLGPEPAKRLHQSSVRRHLTTEGAFPMTTEQARPPNPHRVVIVGAGFGGLEAAFRLAGAPVSITLIDRRNHHLFQPLLYQVATASLATSEIAWPIRYLLRGRPEVTTLFATVSGVDARTSACCSMTAMRLPYDTLVLATGARHAYFGHDEWEPFAPGLKTLEDATTLRRRILVAFERAERESDPERRAALLTFVIVGAGPTGVELAGTIAELAQDTLPPDFRNIDTHKARVVLIEAGPRVLAGFPDDLSAYAHRSLQSLGVEVVLGTGRHRMLAPMA